MRLPKALGSALILALGLLSSAFGAEKVTIHLVNGAVVIGEVTRKEDGKIYLKADLLGDVVVNEKDVVSSASTAQERAAAPERVLPVASHSTSGSEIPVSTQATGVAWLGNVTIGGAYVSAAHRQGPVPGTVSGVTGAQLGLSGVQKSVQASGALARMTHTDSVALEGSYAYAEYEPAPSAVVQNYSGMLTWSHVLNQTDFTVSRTLYLVDRIRNIDHSFAEIVGYGRKLIDTPTDRFELVPGVMVSNEEKGFIYDNQWKADYGFIEHYGHSFNSAVSLEENLLARDMVNRTDFFAFNAYLGITAALSPSFAIKIGATYDFDNSAPYQSVEIPGVPAVFYPNNKGVLNFTTGIQYKFGAPPK